MHISHSHLWLSANKYVPGGVCVISTVLCVCLCVPVLGCLCLLWQSSQQAVEVNVIMEPPLLALPCDPAGWTLSFQLCFSPLCLTLHPSFSACTVSVSDSYHLFICFSWAIHTLASLCFVTLGSFIGNQSEVIYKC